MSSFYAAVSLRIAAIALLSSTFVCAQTPGTPAGIEKKLESEYPLTKTTADRSDIVTSGSVLVLQKDGLMMIAATSTRPLENTYKDGKISQGVWKMARLGGLNGLTHPGGAPTMANRKFVTGEKFWLTKVSVVDDGVVLEFFSDPISEVRYYSSLKFPFAKGTMPTVEQVDSEVAEVVKVQPDDNGGKQQAGGGAAPAPAAGPAAPPPAALAPIAPPPPPADTPPPAPKTIALKQTKDEVIANFGQPTKVVKLGAKEIEYFSDMKVTFVNNKVTDVQ